MNRNKYIPIALLLLILIIGLLIRTTKFPNIPVGFNQDEAASAYESYSLAETGADKWGNVWPVYFPGWGSGQNVLLAYLTIPIIKLWGLSVVSARLVELLLGLLTLPLLFACLRPLGRSTALLGTFLLAVMPWHFMLSRWALESNLVPFFMLLGCTTLSRAFITRKRYWIIPSLLPFALCLYAYGTSIVILPFFLGLVIMLGLRDIWAQRLNWLIAGLLFLIVAAPFLLFFIENYIISRNLAWTDSLFFSTPLLPSTRISQVTGGNWLDTLQQNLQFLLAGCDDGTSYNVMPSFKPLLYLTLPLSVVGLVAGACHLVRRGNAFFSPSAIVLSVFACWGLATLLLLFSFTLNVNRFNHFYLPCVVLAAWAVGLIINNLKPTVPKHLVWLGIVIWIALEGGLAVSNYFGSYSAGPIKQDFNSGLEDAFAAVEGIWGVEQIQITGQMPLPYVYTLFYLHYPPEQFKREVEFSVEQGTYKVIRFGRYVFFENQLRPAQAYGYLSRRNEFPDNNERHREIIFTNDEWEVGIIKPSPR